MLISKKVKVLINTSNINHYLIKGYKNIKRKSEITIPVEDLSKGSNIIIKAKCDICGKEKNIMYFRYLENVSIHNIFSCSRKCSNIKREKTLKDKYNVNNVSQLNNVKMKRKNTMLDRYGVEHALQNKELRDKSLKTNEKLYGTKYPQKLKITKDKIEKTNINRYGVKVAIMRDDIKEKQKATLNHLYNNKILEKYDNIISYDKGDFVFKCEKGHIFKISRCLLQNRKFSNKVMCTKCNPPILNKSSIQFEITNFIKDNYNENILSNNRNIIHPHEIDIYLPDYKLAIEFDGLYWHSKYNKNYHLNKTELCQKRGVQLLHIFENEWLDPIKQDIWKSIINNKDLCP